MRLGLFLFPEESPFRGLNEETFFKTSVRITQKRIVSRYGDQSGHPEMKGI